MTSTVETRYDPLTAGKPVSITAIQVKRTPVLDVTFDDGVTREVDFSDVIRRSRWFRTLSVPTTFEAVEIINQGRGLQWVTGADYCADALRLVADDQFFAKDR